MSETRVRFAPSPTGHLHVGGARTAIYNWLLARQQGGSFVLRIEDTDLERSTDESLDSILEAMAWLGLDWDEGPKKGGDYGPYKQTERFDIYEQYINKLLDEGKAYRCYATKEELDELRKEASKKKETFKYDRRWRDKGPEDWPENKPYSVRFKAPLSGEIVVDDMVKGPVVFEADKHIDDFIIRRSDGTPTYNFTVVVDDVTMKMSHIIRGDDHLNNTPKQILLYQALDFDIPKFAHMPLTLGTDKTRLSKRHGATSVVAYREMGYLPHALLNYLVRLGWSSGDDEIFTKEELIEKFTVEAIGKSAGIFNPEKLLWVNHHYIQNDPPEYIAETLLSYLKTLGIETEVNDNLLEIVNQLAPRAKTMVEMAESARFYFTGDFEYNEKADRKFLKKKNLDLLNVIIEKLDTISEWKKDKIYEQFQVVMEQFELKLGKVAQPVRVAITGTTVSPGLFECLEVLGKEESQKRIKRAALHIENKEEAE